MAIKEYCRGNYTLAYAQPLENHKSNNAKNQKSNFLKEFRVSWSCESLEPSYEQWSASDYGLDQEKSAKKANK